MISGALLAAIASSGSVSEDFQAILSTVVGSDTSSVTLTSSGSSAPWTEFQDLLLKVQNQNLHHLHHQYHQDHHYQLCKHFHRRLQPNNNYLYQC